MITQPEPSETAQDTARPERVKALSGFSWLAAARAAWVIFAVLAVGFLLASIPGYVLAATEGHYAGRVVEMDARLLAVLDALGALISFIAALVYLALAGIIFWRKPADHMALFVSFYLLVTGVVLAGPLERLDALVPGTALLAAGKLQPILAGTPAALFLGLFPSGRFVPGWYRWLLLPSLLVTAMAIVFPPNFWADTSTVQAWVAIVLVLATLIAGLYAQVYRYRNVSSPVERQQTKWAVFGITLSGVWFMLISVPYVFVLNLPPDAPLAWWVPLSSFAWWIQLLIIPLSLTIAVLGYRLWDIDVVVNRTLVYGALTAAVVGLYLLVVGALGALLQARDSLVLSLLGVGLVAVVVQPLRERLQHTVNRLMYGERDDPYAVLSRLGRRLEATLAPEEGLSTIVETLAQALKLPYVAIALRKDRGFQIAAATGTPVELPLVLPLTYQGEAVGQLICGPRGPGEPFNAAERGLLEDVARQAGVAAHAVHLTADLQRSRERLVTAREEERRRLRRDLHDGLGPTLAALHLQTGTLQRLIRADPGAAEAMVLEYRTEIRALIDDIRRLVYELRPPALDELGLVGAIESRAEQIGLGDAASGLRVQIEAPDDLPPLPAAVEVAAYRIIQEALTNAVRHAEASTCTVRLELDRGLRLEVRDDGIGLPLERHTGVGILSMQERAAELGGWCRVEPCSGGGTAVRAHLPLPEE